ncbi:MAG: hypothetical protein U0168_18710 [Nannocystaceae bacterium]
MPDRRFSAAAHDAFGRARAAVIAGHIIGGAEGLVHAIHGCAAARHPRKFLRHTGSERAP